MKYSLFFLSCLAFTCQAEFVYQSSPKLTGQVQVKADDLCQVAKNTLAYIEQFPDDDFAVHQGKLNIENLSLANVKETLDFACQLNSQPLTKDFLLKHFDFYQWLPDKASADKIAKASDNKVKKRLLTNIPDDQIFLTKYYVKQLKAADEKNAEYGQALYNLPFDEQKLTQEQAELKKETLTRFQLTRQQIIAGAIEQNILAEPLVWLSEEALHDVLLQGTGVAEINGKKRFFNVHRNNGIAYDYTLGKREQPRYWYFAEVAGVLGYGTDISNKIPLKANVAFAGNVKELGLGKLFLVNYQSSQGAAIQLGVLADQGGAFDNNLFQLDLLRGSYFGWSDYYQANKHLPDYAHAWLLLKKPVK